MEEALRELKRKQADLLLLDYYVPGQNAPVFIGELLRSARATRIIVVSASLSPNDKAASLSAGALAFVTKNADPDALQKICRDALADRLETATTAEVREPAAETARRLGLTLRQLDVLVMLAHGYSNREIAELLMVRPETVKSHLKAVFDRLGANSRTEAIALARDNGLL